MWAGLGTTLSLLVLLLLPAVAAVADDAGASWDMEVDNRRPFLGDIVLIRVSSVYANEAAHIEVSFNGTTVRNIWVSTTFKKLVYVEWQTSLDAEPGIYNLRLIYRGVEECSLVITLVYDPLDYAMKCIARLERENYYLNKDIDRVESWYRVQDARIDYYLYRWVLAGIIVNVLSILTLFYLGPTAYRKYIFNAARRGGRGIMDWGPTVDGYSIGQMGKESMTRTKPKEVPEPGLSRWCPVCKVLVHKAEFHLHEHKVEDVPTGINVPERVRNVSGRVQEGTDIPNGFEWVEEPKRVVFRRLARRVVRPLRVIKEPGVVPKSQNKPFTPEMD